MNKGRLRKSSEVAALILALLAGSFAGCARDETPAATRPDPKTRAATPVTVTQAVAGAIETVEHTLGTLEALDDPKLAAEVAGHVARLHVKPGQRVRKGLLLAELDPTDSRLQQDADAAETARLKSLLDQQERLISRQSDLVARNFVSRNALDDATAQRDALKNQLAASQARAALSARSVGKTQVLAPGDGQVDELLVAVGDYIKLGDPLLRLVGHASLRANLPFAEAAASRLKRGQTVRLSAPALGGDKLEGQIEELRPLIGEGSRALLAIARFSPDARLRAGGSVNAEVVIGRRADAVLVPEQSLVLRPAGRVVYLVADGKAVQRAVDTGARERGKVEILKGLQAGETVVLDGAGFLSNGFPVAVQAPKKPGAAGAKPAK